MVHHILQTSYKDCSLFMTVLLLYAGKEAYIAHHPMVTLLNLCSSLQFLCHFTAAWGWRCSRTTMFPPSALYPEQSGAIKATVQIQWGSKKRQHSNRMVRHEAIWLRFVLAGDHFMPVVVRNSSDVQDGVESTRASVRVAPLGCHISFEVVAFSRERRMSAQSSFLNSRVVLVVFAGQTHCKNVVFHFALFVGFSTPLLHTFAKNLA